MGLNGLRGAGQLGRQFPVTDAHVAGPDEQVNGPVPGVVDVRHDRLAVRRVRRWPTR